MEGSLASILRINAIHNLVLTLATLVFLMVRASLRAMVTATSLATTFANVLASIASDAPTRPVLSEARTKLPALSAPAG